MATLYRILWRLGVVAGLSGAFVIVGVFVVNFHRLTGHEFDPSTAERVPDQSLPAPPPGYTIDDPGVGASAPYHAKPLGTTPSGRADSTMGDPRTDFFNAGADGAPNDSAATDSPSKWKPPEADFAATAAIDASQVQWDVTPAERADAKSNMLLSILALAPSAVLFALAWVVKPPRSPTKSTL